MVDVSVKDAEKNTCMDNMVQQTSGGIAKKNGPNTCWKIYIR